MVPLSAQKAELGSAEGNNLLVWPFENSYHIDYFSGSNGWSMVNGAGGGLHQNSDFFAFDWLRPSVTTCGIDFKAPLSGTVIWTEADSRQGYGQQVIIQSDQDTNYAFRIAHMESIKVSYGEKVQIGDVLGTIGDTGNGPCHGHLVLYHKIYDRIYVPKTPNDSILLPTDRAIDVLRKGLFISSPNPTGTYFAAPFRFLEREAGFDLIRFQPNTLNIGNKDTIDVELELVNNSLKFEQGRLALMLQTKRDFNYYTRPNIYETELLDFPSKDTLKTQLKKVFFGREPGSYYLFLLLASPDTVKGVPVEMDPLTPLGRLAVEVFSTDLCLRDEPNNERATATPLFAQSLTEAARMREKEAYLSSTGDPKDLYTFSSQKQGRFDLKLLDRPGFKWEISTADGVVELLEEEQQLYFYTQPNVDYYLTVEGPPTCLRSYQFSYGWTPIESLEWTLEPTDVLLNTFDVLEPVEVEWMVFDMLGRRLWQSGKQQLEIGSAQFRDEVPFLQVGIYNIVLMIDGKIADHKRFYWSG